MVIVKLSVMLVVLVNMVVNCVLHFSKGSFWLYKLKKNEKTRRIINEVLTISDYILLGGFAALVFMVHWLYVVLSTIWFVTFIMCHFYTRKNKRIPRVYANGNSVMTGLLFWTIAENFVRILGNF